MRVAQKPAQSLAASNRPLALLRRLPKKQKDVALPLMVPLGMEMVDIGWLGFQSAANRSLGRNSLLTEK